MVKDSMDLLELLRNRDVDGDGDFLREVLRVLMDAIYGRRGLSEDRRRAW